MQELNFRRKRKSPGQKPRRQTKGTKLRFEDRRKKLYFEKRKTGKRPVSIRRVLGLLLQAAVVCAAAVFLSVSFGYRVSNAGDSMNPVLKNGDVVLVNRLIYEIKDPSRGDIVVFRPGGDENSHYSIKRIVGLPGETVQIVDGKVYINGEEADKDIHVSDIAYAGVAEEPVELGEDEYFVIGDNTGVSDDSRTEDVGNVRLEDICGEAWFVANFGEDFGFIRD